MSSLKAVVIEGFRPDVLQRLGLDYATLREINVGLIYCSISGDGVTGANARRAGHDANYLAQAGVLDRNGSDRPIYFDPPIADLSGSLFSAMAILGALNARHRTGVGCQIDLALADVAERPSGFTLREGLERFAGGDCCVLPVQSIAEGMASRHVKERGLVKCGFVKSCNTGRLQSLFPALVNGQPPQGCPSLKPHALHGPMRMAHDQISSEEPS